MKCLKCGSTKMFVVDTFADADEIHRLRKCKQCNESQHTIEKRIDGDQKAKSIRGMYKKRKYHEDYDRAIRSLD